MVTWSLWLQVPQKGLASTAPPPKHNYSPLQQATAFPRTSLKNLLPARNDLTQGKNVLTPLNASPLRLRLAQVQ